MFVAVCDQDFGTSTLSWRKITCPFSFPICAVLFSHSTASYGDTRPSVNRRRNSVPVETLVRRFSCSILLFNAILVSAIISASAQAVSPLKFCVGFRGGLRHYTALPIPVSLAAVEGKKSSRSIRQSSDTTVAATQRRSPVRRRNFSPPRPKIRNASPSRALHR